MNSIILVPLYKVHYFDEVSCRYVPLNGLFDFSEFLALQYVYGLTLIRIPFFNKHFSNPI